MCQERAECAEQPVQIFRILGGGKEQDTLLLFTSYAFLVDQLVLAWLSVLC